MQVITSRRNEQKYVLHKTKSARKRHALRIIVGTLSVAIITLALLGLFGVGQGIRNDAASLLAKTTPFINWNGLSKAFPTRGAIRYANTDHTFGIAAGSVMPSLSDSELQARLDDMHNMGMTWIRVDVEWSNVQPDNATSYDWADYDRVMRAIQAHRMQTVAILDYTPAWARSAGCDSAQCPPRSADEYAAFVSRAVTRYASMGVHVWEVWNEPNNPQFWVPKTDASAYTILLKKAYTAIHTADRYGFVLSGGLSPQPTDAQAISRVDFLQRMYEHGAKNYFDAVSDHPYTFPVPPSDSSLDAWAEMSATHTNLRDIMVAHGDGAKKIWITEFGAPTGGPGPIATAAKPDTSDAWHVTEDLQVAIMTKAAMLYKSYDWAGPFLWYSYKDAGTSQDNNENFFGLVRADGTHKPAYDTYKALAK